MFPGRANKARKAVEVSEISVAADRWSAMVHVESNLEHQAMVKDLNAELRFGFLIHDISRLRRTITDRALKPLGITRSQWWVLAFLSRRDGMTQTALAIDLELTKVAIGGLIDRMEASGIVERRADAADGRAKRIYLTKAGMKLVNAIRASVENVEMEIHARVSSTDLQKAALTLAKIKGTLIDMLGETEDETASVEV
jgi:DNA-binding MarR family transcriptional regulator